MVLTNAHAHASSDNAITIVQSDSNANFFSEGIHPALDVRNTDEKLKIIASLAESGVLTAIGECGLDRESLLSTEEQVGIFLLQLEIARKCSLPVIVHCVGRWNELEKIILKYPQQVFVIHGFRKMKLARQLSHTNVYFSFGEAMLFDANIWNHLREIPRDKLLLETDDKKFDIMESYVKLAELLQIPLQEAISLISNNFHRVFSLVERK